MTVSQLHEQANHLETPKSVSAVRPVGAQEKLHGRVRDRIRVGAGPVLQWAGEQDEEVLGGQC